MATSSAVLGRRCTPHWPRGPSRAMAGRVNLKRLCSTPELMKRYRRSELTSHYRWRRGRTFKPNLMVTRTEHSVIKISDYPSSKQPELSLRTNTWRKTPKRRAHLCRSEEHTSELQS